MTFYFKKLTCLYFADTCTQNRLRNIQMERAEDTETAIFQTNLNDSILIFAF